MKRGILILACPGGGGKLIGPLISRDLAHRMEGQDWAGMEEGWLSGLGVGEVLGGDGDSGGWCADGSSIHQVIGRGYGNISARTQVFRSARCLLVAPVPERFPRNATICSTSLEAQVWPLADVFWNVCFWAAWWAGHPRLGYKAPGCSPARFTSTQCPTPDRVELRLFYAPVRRALRRGVVQLRKARSLSGMGFRSAYTMWMGIGFGSNASSTMVRRPARLAASIL